MKAEEPAEDRTPAFTPDIEKGAVDHLNLDNHLIKSFAWENVTVTVKDRNTKQLRKLLDNVNGIVCSGELLALMGPSGSGKTTLLNVLAHREATAKATVTHNLHINGSKTKLHEFRKISSYVEQEDALIGSLTVKETLHFAAKLSLPSSITKSARLAKIEALISSFGLTRQADTIIGTPIRKGISGGQKRRVSVASQLVTSPKLLFLDEPTSGLDSAASFEVMSFVRNLAKKYNLLVIASIHQPSTSTFALFDKLLLMSHGKVAYNGYVKDVQPYFSSIGHSMPLYTNPAEFIIDLVNTDFSKDHEKADKQLESIQISWNKSELAARVTLKIEEVTSGEKVGAEEFNHIPPSALVVPFTLMHRNFIKSYRDVVAYGIRIAMYICLAIMMGTVWLRLDTTQEHIQAFINAIFFGGAFMSFMAVAYIPSFLEDLHTFHKERLNGLYGPVPFTIANFFTGLPYLFIITILFSVIAYWLSNFRPDATAFFRWILYLFLDLLAAESLVVLVAAIAPIFVVALAVTAFANGLWMSVNGFMVERETLNAFWRYVFHYIDYQAYVFQGMMVNEFEARSYSCKRQADGNGYYCMYPPTVEGGGEISGVEVLKAYGYPTGRMGKWVGILCGIIVGYRVLGLVALYARRH